MAKHINLTAQNLENKAYDNMFSLDCLFTETGYHCIFASRKPENRIGRLRC